MLLFGASHSENDDSDEVSPGYEHIGIVRNLQPPSWDLLNYIKEIKSTSVSTDCILLIVFPFSKIELLISELFTDKKFKSE